MNVMGQNGLLLLGVMLLHELWRMARARWRTRAGDAWPVGRGRHRRHLRLLLGLLLLLLLHVRVTGWRAAEMRWRLMRMGHGHARMMAGMHLRHLAELHRAVQGATPKSGEALHAELMPAEATR